MSTPQTKIARLSESNSDVKEQTKASAASPSAAGNGTLTYSSEANANAILTGNDTLLRHVLLSFLLCNKPEEIRFLVTYQTHRIIKEHWRQCRPVCKVWTKAIWEIASHPGIPGVISTSKLADIKHSIDQIDLTPIHAEFLKATIEKWGDAVIEDDDGDEDEEYVALNLVTQYI